MCVCCCNILLHLDILMLILRCFVENIHNEFLIRCYIGFAFDVIEYVILLCTVRQIDTEQFAGLFTVYIVFILFILIYLCFKENVYMVTLMMVFKSLSLSVAIMIFEHDGSLTKSCLALIFRTLFWLYWQLCRLKTYVSS